LNRRKQRTAYFSVVSVGKLVFIKHIEFPPDQR